MNSKMVLITGAANGIGKSIAEILLKSGYNIIIVDYDAQSLQTTYKQFSKIYTKNIIIDKVCDVGNPDQVNLLIKSLGEIGYMPDILINNAGYGGPFQMLNEISDEEWEKVIDTNLRGIFNFSRAILPIMKSKNWGKIINIASVQGLIGASLSSTYIASKHGVVGYTKAIAAEWGRFGIRCNAICPGYVNTAMGAQDNQVPDHHRRIISRTPLAALAAPEDVANLVEFLISEKANFINGSIITIDGGLSADIGIT